MEGSDGTVWRHCAAADEGMACTRDEAGPRATARARTPTCAGTRGSCGSRGRLGSKQDGRCHAAGGISESREMGLCVGVHQGYVHSVTAALRKMNPVMMTNGHQITRDWAGDRDEHRTEHKSSWVLRDGSGIDVDGAVDGEVDGDGDGDGDGEGEAPRSAFTAPACTE